MPYIDKERRALINVGAVDPETAGELNYALTMVAKRYLQNKGLKYSTINDIVGALEGAKLEFYARIARPYEDKKIQENGDCF